MAFVNGLKRWLISANTSVYAFAAKIGVPHTTLRYWAMNKPTHDKDYKLLYIKSKGLIDPNCFFDIESWKKEMEGDA